MVQNQDNYRCSIFPKMCSPDPELVFGKREVQGKQRVNESFIKLKPLPRICCETPRGKQKCGQSPVTTLLTSTEHRLVPQVVNKMFLHLVNCLILLVSFRNISNQNG